MNKKAANIIRSGQQWKKKDTGVIVEIVSKQKDDKWMTYRPFIKTRKSAHVIKRHDLLKHYDLL